MGETGEAASKFELVEAVRNEVIEEFQPTDIVSQHSMRNNLKSNESSITQILAFYLKKHKFLQECLEKCIFLEGLITSVFMVDSSLTDIFESGIIKGANLSELGDIQTLLSAVTQWCAKLHTKSGKQRCQQVAWFHRNGFKETTFKEIDKQLRDRYTEVVALVSNLKKPPALSFNKDAWLVHETMMEIIAKLWHNRLCIYQGHKDLGYVQISSKVQGLIGRKSCYSLANEPPRFVLALDVLNNDHIPEELNLLSCIRKDLVSSILSKYHNTTPKKMADQFFCIPVATKYMSFELGSLASSGKFCERLKVICGHVTKVLYDRDLRQLSVLCPKGGCDRVKSVLEEELKSLQTELETRKLEIPFPNLHSPLRMQIGEGLQCVGIIGFQWFRDRQLREVRIRKCASISDFSEAAECSLTHKEDKRCMQKRRIEDLYNYQHLSATKNDVEYECYTVSLIDKQTNNLHDDVVVFDSSVKVLLQCLIKDKLKDEKNGIVLMSFKDAKTIVIAGVIRVFAEVGLRTDGRENSTAVWAQTNSESPSQFELKIVFPNVYAARTGVRCIESISSSNFSVAIRQSTKLATDLKTIRIILTPGFYHVIEKPLQELLGRMQQKNIVESWVLPDPLSSLNRSNFNLQVSVTATENCHVRSLTHNLEDFFQPAKVTVNIYQLPYLQSNDGTKFLTFLMHFTKTLIRLPAFQQNAYIYGDLYNKNQSASILKRQLIEKYNSCGLKWYLYDFGKTCFNCAYLKISYQKMKSRLDQMKRNGDISQYFLFEDRPELWLETKPDVFERYSRETKSTLLRRMDVASIDKKTCSPECPVCMQRLEISSADCYVLSACGHAYCRRCLLQLVIQSTKDRKLPIKCVFGKCNKAFSVVELWYICGVVQVYDIRKILRNVLKSFVADNAASFGLCLRRRCGAMCVVYEQEKMKACLLCQGRFCLQCDGKFHGTKACDEVWSIDDWLRVDSRNRKRCPNCRIAIEKDRGCNVVFCEWCKKYICWTCGQFHSDSPCQCHGHADRCTFSDS